MGYYNPCEEWHGQKCCRAKSRCNNGADRRNLTYWSQDKILQTILRTFSSPFLFENCCILIQISLKIVLNGSVNDESSMVQIRVGTGWKRIIWTNHGIGYRRIYASLGLNCSKCHKPAQERVHIRVAAIAAFHRSDSYYLTFVNFVSHFWESCDFRFAHLVHDLSYLLRLINSTWIRLFSK